MDVRIQAIKFDATERLENHIEKKIAKLEKLLDNIQSVEVFLKVVKPEAPENKEVEVKVQAPYGDFFASKTTDTFEESIDLAVEALEKQIKKFKEKK